jgi:broad specificity phosphatase PhoE
MEQAPKETESATTFGLLRHGQTEWNILKKVQGSGDSPLSSEGKKQTARWARTLRDFRWNRIVASDLGRVRATVDILNRELLLPATFDQRLREQHWGDWEGLTIPFIQENFQEDLARRVAKGWDFAPPGGESRIAVKDRALAYLREAAEQWSGQNILVICHQGVVKSVLYWITGRKYLPGEDPLLQHDRLHLISCVSGRFTPLQLNISPAARR